MKHTELLILSLLFLPQFTTAQSLLVGRVVDAETGETLPFAKVMMADNHGTLSNRDGDFSIMGTADDVLTVSYIGYEKETVKATALPAIIRLKPLVAEMGEVVVLPQPKGDILDSIRRKLHAEYVANWDKTSLYFFRAFTEREDSISDILEGFYDAFSAVNIGRPVIKSGQTRMFGKTDAKELLKTNFQRLFLLGPVIYEENFWTRTLQPLGESDEFKKAYDANFITMYTEEGQKIYKIRFLFNGWAPKDWPGRALIQGTLYVDAETYGLLHFDGEVLGMRQILDGVRRAMKLTFRVDYSHERGFTEVTHISFEGGTPELFHHCLLFKVDESQTEKERMVASNLVKDIQTAGYDESLWDKYDIVRRTEEEERIVAVAKEGEKE